MIVFKVTQVAPPSTETRTRAVSAPATLTAFARNLRCGVDSPDRSTLRSIRPVTRRRASYLPAGFSSVTTPT